MSDSFQLDLGPDGVIPVEPGESILQAALNAGVPMLHVCGGNARCSTCRILVLSGAAQLSEPNPAEINLKSHKHIPSHIRLSCQTRVLGPGVKATRILRDESDMQLYLDKSHDLLPMQMTMEGEVAIFFLDIRGFTAIVEEHPAFDMIHIIRKLFFEFNAIISRFEGRIVETTGDGIYAVFYHTDSPQANTQLAVDAGLAILDKLNELNRQYFQRHFNRCIEVGIGIHTGAAVGGDVNLGDEKHMVIMGYPVNLAARLQNATKELNSSLIMSKSAYDLLPNKPIAREIKKVELKGIREPVEAVLIGKPYLQRYQP